MAEEKKAKKVYTLDDIKFKEANKTMAILACIPIVGLILMLVEKEDDFVRYMGAQFTILGAVQFVLAIIPVIGWMLSPLFAMVVVVAVIVGMVKASKGERFDLPLVSEWALKLMGAF